MTLRVVIVSNALDDATRQQRGITTDSPAASRKVFMLCQALRMAGVHPFVLSLGRGRAGGDADFFSATVRRVNGIPVLYAPFYRVRLASELISLFALPVLLRAIRRRGPCSVVFYNRMTAYLPTLLASRVWGNRNFLDLEDGEVLSGGGVIRHLVSNSIKNLFDRFCHRGALLACTALSDYTRIRPVLCYYGTSSNANYAPRFQSPSVSVLMGGTLSPDTGAKLLIDAIVNMRKVGAAWVSRLTIHVTGSGPSVAEFQALADSPGHPSIRVYGRTTNAQYTDILRACDVGLALKLHSGTLADTTFPSKVIEYASAGLLVLTTDISDVRLVLGEGALYLPDDSATQLEMLLERVVSDIPGVQRVAALGYERVQAQCSSASAGRMIADFVTGAR